MISQTGKNNEAPRAEARGFLKRNTEAALFIRPRCFALRSKATGTVFPSFCSGLCWPRMYKKLLGMSRRAQAGQHASAFTLVELMVAVAVIAIGMVFILGAFSQCMSALTTARKTVIANYLLNGKMWESDMAMKLNNGSPEGEWSGVFSEPYENFNWTQKVQAVSGDFSNETAEYLNEETTRVSWVQGHLTKDVSVVRYVKKKNETAH